jgi:regulator of extracellular matrix RemA (YlzA/DUF370 family)
MTGRLINLGFDYMLAPQQLIAMVDVDSAPIRRLVQQAQDWDQLIDATQGRSPQTAIISQRLEPWPPQPPAVRDRRPSDPSAWFLTLSALHGETIAHRAVGFPSSSSSLLALSPPNPMDIRLINIGFGNIVSANRVVAIVSPESAPIKRLITEARERGQLVDATYGRRTRAVIVMDFGHVILSAIQPETVANRFMAAKESAKDS